MHSVVIPDDLSYTAELIRHQSLLGLDISLSLLCHIGHVMLIQYYNTLYL